MQLIQSKKFRQFVYLTLLCLLLWTISQYSFLERIVTYPSKTEITQSSWYSPLETVHGDFKEDLQPADETILHKIRPSIEKIEAYAMERNTAGLLVLHQGKIILEKYAPQFSQDSTTNSMSMAKTILALLIGIAIDEGKIHSEKDFVAQYLPEWKNDSRNQITLEHLLHMTSGLSFNDNPNSLFSDIVSMHVGTQIKPLILNIHPKKAPGLEYEYLNVNSQILSLVLERATGQRYSEYLSDKLWKRLGARDAHLWLDKKNGTPKTYCCLFTNVRDWARVGQLFLNSTSHPENHTQTSIVSPGWIKKMITPSPLRETYGYHITVGKNAFYLDGRGKQKVYVIPSQDLVIVRVGESPQNWDDSLFTQVKLPTL